MKFERSGGILLHPTSLPGPYGIGDLGPQAYRFVDWLESTGCKLWQILPLGPTGYGDSPYQCFSAFAGNPYLISFDLLIDEGLLTQDDFKEKPDFPASRVDFGWPARRSGRWQPGCSATRPPTSRARPSPSTAERRPLARRATFATMVLEVAILNLRPRRSEAFEAAFREAQQIISHSQGYQRHELRRCVEAADRYLLLVWWDTLESHTQGFRASPGYRRWRELLHPLYEPFPTVEHYVEVPGTVA